MELGLSCSIPSFYYLASNVSLPQGINRTSFLLWDTISCSESLLGPVMLFRSFLKFHDPEYWCFLAITTFRGALSLS